MAQPVHTPAPPKKRLRLIRGREMCCPRCRTFRDILAWVPLQRTEAFMEETAPIYKCPECRWVFAPIAAPSEAPIPEDPIP